ncbi:unnamed protein product [Clavelina lepadiformis]|uniref:Uncharacterized protein n=1 Tax=Clavelina lepadiformis TaxID=159417 RepID=A0ABP0FLN1_CLALP
MKPNDTKWKVLLLFLYVVSWEVDARLACQKRRDEIILGTIIIPTTSRPIAPIATPRRSSFGKPDLCCGRRAFNSEINICCLGKLINKNEMMCCLNGAVVPRVSRCLCYPTSKWIITEHDRLTDLETEYSSLIEAFDYYMEDITVKVITLEEVLELLDSQANSLYQAFLAEIDSGTSEDPSEVDYIINLILFLNTNEASIDNAKKSLIALDGAREELQRDDVLPPTKNSPSKSKEETPMSGQLAALRSEMQSLNSSIETATSMLDMTRHEIGNILPDFDNREEIERIVLERGEVLEEINHQSRELRATRAKQRNIADILAILRADQDLLAHKRTMLDGLLDEVLAMEKSMREELSEMVLQRFEEGLPGDPRVLSRAKRSVVEEEAVNVRQLTFLFPELLPPPENKPPPTPPFHNDPLEFEEETDPPEIVEELTTASGPNSDALNTSRTPCNFTAWDRFVNNFERRTALVTLDLVDIEGARDEIETSSVPSEKITEQESRIEIDFNKHGHGVSADPESNRYSRRTKRSVEVKKYVISDDEIKRFQRKKAVREYSFIASLKDFEGFHVSESFKETFIKLIRRNNLEIYGPM